MSLRRLGWGPWDRYPCPYARLSRIRDRRWAQIRAGVASIRALPHTSPPLIYEPENIPKSHDICDSISGSGLSMSVRKTLQLRAAAWGTADCCGGISRPGKPGQRFLPAPHGAHRRPGFVRHTSTSATRYCAPEDAGIGLRIADLRPLVEIVEPQLPTSV